jgi:hypothetical protein
VATLEDFGYRILLAEPGLPFARNCHWDLGWLDKENFLAVKPINEGRLKGWRGTSGGGRNNSIV